jgi:hypothetical protein
LLLLPDELSTSRNLILVCGFRVVFGPKSA